MALRACSVSAGAGPVQTPGTSGEAHHGHRVHRDHHRNEFANRKEKLYESQVSYRVLLSLWAPGAWAGCDPRNHAWIVSYFPQFFRRRYRLRGRNGISEPGITGDLPGVARFRGRPGLPAWAQAGAEALSLSEPAWHMFAWTVTT